MLVFDRKDDAERVMAVLPKRFAKYGLTLHPEKTRMIELVRPDLRARRITPRNLSGRPGTFDFLGFTHYWGRSPKAKWILYRKTAKDRFQRSLKQISEWCRTNRHLDLRIQRQHLWRKLQGHYEYFGILGNSRALKRFRFQVIRVWRKWLSRRSQRAYVDWKRMLRLLERYSLPPARLPRKAWHAAKP